MWRYDIWFFPDLPIDEFPNPWQGETFLHGKLPGPEGITGDGEVPGRRYGAGWGDRRNHGNDGWSARQYFRTGDPAEGQDPFQIEIRSYLYPVALVHNNRLVADHNSDHYTQWDFPLRRGQRYTVTGLVVLNEAHTTSGEPQRESAKLTE